MKTITITTQAELDALPSSFEKYTEIHIKNDKNLGSIIVKQSYKNAIVTAYDNSSVTAYDNSYVTAYDNSSIAAYDNSSVVAYGNSSVVAYGNSSVRAYGNSSVVAYDNSSVTAYGNSSIVACSNSSVTAWGNVAVRAMSKNASISLFMYSACWAIEPAKIEVKSSTATVITPTSPKTIDAWLESQEVVKEDNHVVLFKRVSKDFKTQENTKNETTWEVGKELEHANWSPQHEECGEGKFHACSKAYFCDQFRSGQDDKYIAVKVHVDDLFCWLDRPTYPHKIAFRKGVVLYECDKYGKKK